jgi:hypothetical protein
MAVDEAQGAAPSDLSCFGGKAIAFVALEAVISVIGVDVDRRLLVLRRVSLEKRQDSILQLLPLANGDLRAAGRAVEYRSSHRSIISRVSHVLRNDSDFVSTQYLESSNLNIIVGGA